MAKITRRTGKMDRIGGIIGAIMSGAFALIGFAIPSDDYGLGGFGGMYDPFFDGGMQIFSVFKIVWILICSAICIYCIYMAIKGEGIPTETIDVENNGDPLIHVQVDQPAKPSSTPSDFEARLRKIEKLRADGLISEAEYQEKRRQIMGEKW